MRRLIFFLLASCCVWANPKGGEVKAGGARFHESSGLLEIQTDGRSIIEWKDFSIEKGEVTRFIQASSEMAVLNRVKSGEISRILGTLESNGQIYLINPLGIYIGTSGFIQTAGFFASAFDVLDAEFLQGHQLNFKDESKGSVVNWGTIETQDGPIGLIGYTVENHGNLKGGDVFLKIGSDPVLIHAKRSTYDEISMQLEENDNPYRYAIRHVGEIEAKHIVVAAETGKVTIEGRCKSETIDIRGAEIELSPCSFLEAPSIIAVAENHIAALGSLIAKGDQKKGFIEISGSSLTFHPTFISTLDAYGQAGMLLLDPNDIVIQAANPTSGGFSNPYSGAGFNPAELQISDLVTALATTNVTVVSNAAGAGTGLITIQDPVSWASNQNLIINALSDVNVDALVQCLGNGGITVTSGGDINVVATANPAGFALSGGDISLTTTGNLNVHAGTGVGATARVTTESGSITASADNVSVLGGSVNVDLYAEISSTTGNVTFTSIGGDLTLTGGSTQGSYAQIGKGTFSGGGSSVTSDVTFSSITGNVTVTGGTANATYAQIGHAPSGGANLAVTGAITFPMGGVGGSITLQGQTGTLATAIIGHGNEGSTTTATIEGPIVVRAQQGIFLNGGSVSQTHAIIGYHSPRMGGASPFSSTSNNSITVQNTLINGVELTAGMGSNAVIGYYNDGVMGSTVNIDISQIAILTPSSAFDVILQGGSVGAAQAGVAAIGTYVNPNAPNNSSISGIDITAGSVRLLGPGAGGDGAARILNNALGQSGSSNIIMTLANDLQVMGGAGSGFADIYSEHDLSLFIGRDFLVNTTTQHGYAHAIASNNITVNPLNPGVHLEVIGGSSSTSDALIEATNGAIVVGTLFTSGFTDITVGDPLMQASAQIVGGAGSSIINGITNFSLLGGSLAAGSAVTNARAQIRTTTGPLHLIGGGRLTMAGGSSPFCYAEISSTGGDLTLDINNNIVLEGGSGANAYAQIGKGSTAIDGATSISSSIVINSSGGSLTLEGSTAGIDGIAAYPQIGHSPFGAPGSATVTGDIIINVLGPTVLNAGDNTDVTAIIGHGNEITSTLANCSGSISLTNSSQGVTLNAGTATHTHAIIGFHSPTAGATFACNSPTVQVTANAGDIVLNASDMNNAVIGYYNEGAPVGVNLTISDLTVQALGSNNITLNAGNDGGSLAGVAAIGSVAVSGSTAQSNITIVANNGTLTLQGPLGMDNGRARVINNQNSPTPVSAPYDITITAQNVVVVGGTATPPLGQAYGYADMYSCRNLTLSFLQDLTVNNIMQTGYAHIVGYQNCLLNNGGGGLNAYVVGGIRPTPGGSDPGADALVEALNGQVGIGTFGPGANNIFIGDAQSLAISRVVAVLDNNFVSAQNNITVQGGAGDDVVALIQNTSGPTYVNAGNNLSFTGGTGGDRASAEIRSDSGMITVFAGGETTLTGGGNMMMSNDLCFAQIASNTGDIEFTSIGNNLILTGGYGTHNYAQIGKGVANGVTNITSNITFNNIGGNVVLQGQAIGTTGASSYTQIGHSPFGDMMNILVTGNITLSSVGGTVELNGSNNTNTTAIIGHGNELSDYVTSITSNIFVQDNGNGITLTPGSVAATHAVIGFANPDGGSMPPFSVTSGQLMVESGIGPIILNGGNGVNAIIGYYNNTTPPTVSVTIDDLTVQTDSLLGTVTLLAGNDNMTDGGVAVIGTVVRPGGMNVSQSNITITSGALNVLGPSGTNDGLALVTNNQLGVSTIGQQNFDVMLNLQTGTVLGGVGGMSGFAEIYSSRLLNLNYQSAFNINFDSSSPATLQERNGLVVADSNIRMNIQGSIGNFTVIGGAHPTVISEMSSTQGNIIGGTYGFLPGMKNMTIGTSSMVSPARVYATTGYVQLQGTGTLLVQGGDALAELSAGGSQQILMSDFINGNVVVQSGTGGVAQIVAGTDLAIVADANIQVTGNVSHPATITGSGNTVSLDAQLNIEMGENSFITNTGPGTLLAIAGINIRMLDGATITSHGNLTLVVDNLYPTPPEIGNGRFIKNNAAIVASSGGAVLIYTARQPLNQIQGLINGSHYVAGPEFIDSATEKWAIYYPGGSGGHPFTIFYKDPDVIPPSVLTASQVSSAFAELIYDLNSYDDVLYHPLCFTILYKTFSDRPEGAISSFDLIPQRCYSMVRKYTKNYHLKKIDPLK